MGMGSLACSICCVEYDTVKKLCANELEKIESNPLFESWTQVALWCAGLDSELEGAENAEEFLASINLLQERFREKTEVNGVGLGLFFTYYDQDAGDRYDDVVTKDGGCIFEITGAYQMTPAAEQIKEHIRVCNYTVFC